MTRAKLTTVDAVHRERLFATDLATYTSLYQAAADRLGTGCLTIDGALAIWNPGDDDPAYNYLTSFEAAADPDRTWARGLDAARAGGARVFGVGITAERDDWAQPERLDRLDLTYAEDELVWTATIPAAPVEMPPLAPEIVIDREGFDADTFATALNRGWEEADDHARGWLYALTIGLPGWFHYLVRSGGEPAGAAALYVNHGVANLAVAATVPAFRGRGIQSSLIATRLADARTAGCDLAVVETVPDNASPRNVERAGFTLIARRRIFARRLV